MEISGTAGVFREQHAEARDKVRRVSKKRNTLLHLAYVRHLVTGAASRTKVKKPRHKGKDGKKNSANLRLRKRPCSIFKYLHVSSCNRTTTLNNKAEGDLEEATSQRYDWN